MNTKKTTVYRCPWCGNRKPSLIENNGLKVTDPELTLLCLARINPENSSFPPLHVVREPRDSDGLVECGYQWNPLDE